MQFDRRKRLICIATMITPPHKPAAWRSLVSALSAAAVAGAAFAQKSSPSPGNWLADGGFEQRAEARELGPPSAADRRDFGELHGWSLDDTQACEGKRSLRLKGPRPFTWRLAREYPSETDAVFSFYVRGDRPGMKIEAGVEVMAIDDHQDVRPRVTQTIEVALTPEWQRVAVPARVEKKTDQGYLRMHLLKTWVRPLASGHGDVWIDAAQFEVGRAEPGDFTTTAPAGPIVREEKSLLRDWFGASPAIDPTPPPPAADNLPRGEVKFSVSEHAGVARTGEIAAGGLFFAEGQVFDTTRFEVVDVSGKPVRAQTTILARRPHDGSAISVLVEIPVDVAAKGRRDFVLRYGPDAAATPANPARLIDETDDGFVLRAGATEWRLSKNEFAGFVVRGAAREGFSGFELTTIDGRRFTSAGVKPEIAAIEHDGPLHAVLRYRGTLADDRGARLGVAYDCRLHAFAGDDSVQVEISYEQQERVQSLPVRSIGLALPVPSTKRDGRASVTLRDPASGEPGRALALTSRRSLTLTQLRQYFGEGRHELVVDRDGELVRHPDARATGAVRLPDTAIAVEDFDNLNPAAIAWTPGRVTIYAQPPRHATYLDLPFGISQTLRFWIGPAGAHASLTARTEHPLRVFADPAHTAAARVLGERLLTSAEAEEFFPGFERPLRAFFDTFNRNVRRQGTTGAFDFGDAGSPGSWKNNETSLISALLAQYLRGGDEATLRRAEIMARTFRDVAVLHAGPNSKWIQTHAAGLRMTNHWHVGHFWTTGLVWHYLLTGDRRSYEAARGSAAELLSRHTQRYTGRDRGRMLYHLAELYELTHYTILREAYETHLAHDVPMAKGLYYSGINILALEKWRRVAGDTPEIRRRLLDYGKHLLETVAAHPDLLTDVAEDRDHHVFSAAASLAALTDDPGYIRAFADRFALQALNAHSLGVNRVRGAEFLYQAKRLGVPLSPLTPRTSANIVLLSGRAGGRHDAALELRGRTGATVEEPLRLYKLVGFRAGKKAEDDVIRYRLTGHDSGREVAAGELTGPKFGTLELPLAPRTEYRLSLACKADAQVEVANGTDWDLAADRWVFFRQHRHGNGFVTFDVTPSDQGALEFGLDWSHAWPGLLMAAELLDADGRRVSQVRWGLPLGRDWTDDGRVLEPPARLRLPVPKEHLGRSLRLEIEAAKWLGWRIESGLTEPWLRAAVSR